MKYTRLIVLGFLLIFAQLSWGQTLWRATEYGMSPEKVQAKVPEAIPTLSELNTLKDGSKELLHVPKLTLVGKEFRVSFYFKDLKLNQVTLSFEEGHTYTSAMLVFDSLKEALRARYGVEIASTSSRGLLNKAETTWVSGRTNINLIALAVGDKNAVLNVNYQARLLKEADKL